MLGQIRIFLTIFAFALSGAAANASFNSPDDKLTQLVHNVEASAHPDYRRGYEAFRAGDIAKAIEWFRKAADGGDAKAQTNLGMLYIYGDVEVEDGNALALKYFEMAAEQGDGAAFRYIGDMHDPRVAGGAEPLGTGEAMKWYRKSAKLGHAPAMYELAAIHESVYQVKEAKTWLLMAADHGHAFSMSRLADAYQDGSEFWGIAKNPDAALKWRRLAAVGGDTDSQFMLGTAYENGSDKDLAQAAYWYRKSAEQDNSDAAFSLAKLFHDGRGIGQNSSRAAYWYWRAALQWNAPAQFRLAESLREGNGVERDAVGALMWFEIAIKTLSDAGDYDEALVAKAAGLAKQLSDDQITTAKTRALACLESEFKTCNGPGWIGCVSTSFRAIQRRLIRCTNLARWITRVILANDRV